ALRCAGLGQRRGGDAAVVDRLQAWCGRRAGHPRRAARVLGPSGGLPARRPGRGPDPPRARRRFAAHVGADAMSATLLDRPVDVQAGGNGGAPARQAVVRWAWRLFRREWRQQVLVLALLTVAVAATILGAAIGTNTPPPSNAGYGTADHLALVQA